MTEYWMVIKPAPKIRGKIKEELEKIWMPATGSSWLMERKRLKYVPAIIRSAYAYGEKEVEEVKKDPYVSYLMNKVKVIIRKCPDNIRVDPKTNGPGLKIFWPIEVLEVKEVDDELKMLLTKVFFSKDNLEDRMIAEEDIRRFGIPCQEKQMTSDQRIDHHIDSMNSFMKAWGEFFKKAYDIHKQYNVKMWFPS